MDEANNDAFYEDKLQALKDAILKRHGRLQEGDLVLMHRLFKKLDYEREASLKELINVFFYYGVVSNSSKEQTRNSTTTGGQ